MRIKCAFQKNVFLHLMFKKHQLEKNDVEIMGTNLTPEISVCYQLLSLAKRKLNTSYNIQSNSKLP